MPDVVKIGQVGSIKRHNPKGCQSSGCTQRGRRVAAWRSSCRKGRVTDFRTTLVRQCIACLIMPCLSPSPVSSTDTSTLTVSRKMSLQQTKFYVIFEEGRKRYEKKSGHRLDITFSASLTTVADVRGYVERENDKFAAFRNKNRNVYERLTVAFTPIERISHVVAAASSTGFPPAGACLGAAALLIKSAQNVSAHYDRIIELFDVLAVRVPILLVYMRLTADQGIMDRFELHNLERTSPQIEENFANVLATILEMIGYSTKAIMRKRWKEYMARLLQGDDQKMEQLRTRLDRLVRDGTSLVIEQIYTTVNDIGDRTKQTAVQVEDIKGDTSQIGMDIGDMKDTNRTIIDLLQKQHQTKRDNDLYDIIGPAQPNTDKMEAILRDRVSGTGNWLLAEPAFASWLRQKSLYSGSVEDPVVGRLFSLALSSH
jgi:hypothetical protein